MKHCLVLFLMLCLSVQAGAEGAEWPGWRGPSGTGVSDESGWNPLALENGARRLWNSDVGYGFSNVAILDNRLYTMGRSRETNSFLVSCLDALTGQIIWTFDKLRILGDALSTPTTDGTFVYCLAKDGTIFCLQASDGGLVWKKSLESDFGLLRPTYGWASSPVVEGDLLILNAGTAGLALKKSSGEVAWASRPVSPKVSSYASPVIVGGRDQRMALLESTVDLSAVRVDTGKILWSFPHGDSEDVVADPVPLGTEIFFSHRDYGMLLKVDAGKIRWVWTNAGLRSGISTPVYANGNLYATHWIGIVSAEDWGRMREVHWPFRCLDLASGKTLWETTMRPTSVIAADGKLIILEIDGTLHIAEASSDAYHELSHADVLGGTNASRLFTTPPALVAGKVYCRNYAGDLVCIDVSR